MLTGIFLGICISLALDIIALVILRSMSSFDVRLVLYRVFPNVKVWKEPRTPGEEEWS